MSPPVYVFLGGVSHTPVFFEETIKHLSARGIKSTAIAYPTCGDNTENVTQQDEIVHIQNVVSGILDSDNDENGQGGSGSDVVLVMHSYGGWPGSRAVEGLDKETRQKNGKTTGIIELVFIAAFLLPDHAPMATWSYLPDWLTVENGRRIPNKSCIPLLFSDMSSSPEQQSHWLSQFSWQRNCFVGQTCGTGPWHLSVPKTYVVTTCDRGATPAFQFSMLSPIMEITPQSWRVKSIASGHEPFLTRPRELVEVLLS